MANFTNNNPLPIVQSADGTNRQTFPVIGGGENNININQGNNSAGRNVPVPTFTDFSARSPPKGTPSSYGKFIQKRGRLGSGAVSYLYL